MQININDVVIHLYDVNNDTILKTKEVEYNVPFMEWIENILKTKDLKFVLEYRNFFQDASKYAEDFNEISKRIFEKMVKNNDIEKADMAYVLANIEQKEVIVGLKLNYATNYTHKIEANELRLTRLNTYPIKIKEAFIYYIDSKQLFICEKTFEEEGKKVYYLSKYALEIEHMSKSQISKMKSVKSTMNKLNTEIFENDLESAVASFDAINNKLLESKEITIAELVQCAYQDKDDQEKILTHLDRKNIKPLEIIKTTNVLWILYQKNVSLMKWVLK